MGENDDEIASNPNQKPNFWDYLSPRDKEEYLSLKSLLDESSTKRNRGHRMEAFDGILEAIHRYAERHDDDDWRRFLVCGVCWMDNMIAINTRQLRLLISKCKSSINGSFQKMGYTTSQSHTESRKFLFGKIPLLKGNFNELRQWTIRSRAPQPQQIEAYAVSHSYQIPQDPSQPIQMQISLNPQIAQSIRTENQPLQQNLIIPQNIMELRSQQQNQNQSQKPSAPSHPVLPILADHTQKSSPLQPPPISDLLASKSPTNDGPQIADLLAIKPPSPNIPEQDPLLVEKFCPLKFRSKCTQLRI
ncbi:hypothetical protein TVAG_110840 [Trichomonas vaginalis G3]|uniref:Initiator binding domain-containing protein n=1 Tax=Trichomonas vaginalis (strain ATCC PRA-98 / G3) TaxID=412133 RepID=A2DGT4_TRIV3|nr:transcription-initiator DNA-binding domain ibd family [Trichomonas vaginalis G3]EAY20471.1 hypothetical protein TVAG_110840 [Trichomonas vaginalis G3]KAI5490475.1 transcription-initiator DNA-binding domain ibd family [Trichomonas vaginalis G3]|eukprot:XP_001581457.1 hypothetical protein [Trichomonas vaginalis G3]